MTIPLPQYICCKAAFCKNPNLDICIHKVPHEQNNLCKLQDAGALDHCYKAYCNPILVDWDK